MKVKLMTESGFSKMDNVKELSSLLRVLFRRKIEAVSPEFQGVFIPLHFETIFKFVKKYKNYALYKQVDVLVDLDK